AITHPYRRGMSPPFSQGEQSNVACSSLESGVELHVFNGERMFTPDTFGIALVMMITATVCWGSWANTFKGVKNYRFELFYWDYAIGIFLISLILALTM